jgi:AcrR family transcriptional regulator
MGSPTKPVDGRRVRARANRQRVVGAAYRLFCDRGFEVPMTAIAAEAGVSVQSLYFTFHTKVELLRAALQFAVHGDDQPTPPHERPWFAAMVAEPDPQRAISILLEGTQGIYERLAPLAGVFHAGDDEVREMWQHSEELRHAGMTLMTEALIRKAPLRPSVDVATAADIVFVLLGPQTYQEFASRGWTLPTWQQWTAQALVDALFAGPPHR